MGPNWTAVIFDELHTLAATLGIDFPFAREVV